MVRTKWFSASTTYSALSWVSRASPWGPLKAAAAPRPSVHAPAPEPAIVVTEALPPRTTHRTRLLLKSAMYKSAFVALKAMPVG